MIHAFLEHLSYLCEADRRLRDLEREAKSGGIDEIEEWLNYMLRSTGIEEPRGRDLADLILSVTDPVTALRWVAKADPDLARYQRRRTARQFLMHELLEAKSESLGKKILKVGKEAGFDTLEGGSFSRTRPRPFLGYLLRGDWTPPPSLRDEYDRVTFTATVTVHPKWRRKELGEFEPLHLVHVYVDYPDPDGNPDMDTWDLDSLEDLRLSVHKRLSRLVKKVKL